MERINQSITWSITVGAFSGPEISNDGLILYLDASNRKSFAGVGTERVGTLVPSFNNWNGLVGTSVAYAGKNGRPGINLNITAANGGGVNYWGGTTGTLACLSSTQYTITALVRYAGNTPSANLFYIRQYNSGGTQTSEGGKYNSSNQKYVGDGFYLTWATFTTDATATSFFIHGYDYSNIQIWLEDIQCKLGGLSDTSGNSNNGALTGTMALSSASGGVIQLSGNNYISTGLNLTTGTYTIIAAARYVTTGGRIITSLSNNWLMGHWNGTPENYYAEGWVSNVSTGTSDTNWRILAATGNTATDSWQMHVNGFQTFSNTNGSAGPNNLGINISGERSNSEVGFLLAYNRVLSAAEIQQNFYTFRGRFNI